MTAIGCGNHIRKHGHVDAALGNLASNGVRKVGRDLLACGWRVFSVLDAEQQTTTGRVGEGYAILGQLVPVGVFADHGL